MRHQGKKMLNKDYTSNMFYLSVANGEADKFSLL